MNDKKNLFYNLDCTLRDGGYYNNWDFSKKFIQNYLNYISKTNISYVELGFRFNEKKKIKGLTAYTTNSLLKSLRIPDNIDIGVMVNASDLVNNKKNSLDVCKNIFKEISFTPIKFVRLACHFEEIFKIKKPIKWLKQKKIKIYVNLMQISEISKRQLINTCSFLNKTDADIFYVADSLGSLKPNQAKTIFTLMKKYFKKEIGLHAHNNLNLALKNSVEAINNGANWIDSTITGMGRGPGNLRTEDILKFQRKHNDLKIINKSIKRQFKPLQKKYKWGPNQYYNLAAKFKIHPTYIQKILSDKRYTKKNYLNIINNLRKIDTRKFNPYKLTNNSAFLISKQKGKYEKINIEKNRPILILGPGQSIILNKKKLLNFVKINKPYVICLNTVKLFNESLVDLRVACHPMRILSDMNYHLKTNTRIAVPFSMITKSIKSNIRLKRKRIYDYGLKLDYEKKISILKNYCVLPYPLAIGYALSIIYLNAKDNQIYFAGLDGYSKSKSQLDETEEMLNKFKIKFNKKFLSLTPTKYNF